MTHLDPLESASPGMAVVAWAAKDVMAMVAETLASESEPHTAACVLHRSAVSYWHGARERLLQLGVLLRTLQDLQIGGRLYHEWLGFETWVDYLAAPEEQNGLDVSQRTAYRLMGYAEFLQAFPVFQERDVPLSKVDIVRSVVTPENVNGWLTKVQVLSRSDLIAEVREARGEAPREGAVPQVANDGRIPGLMRDRLLSGASMPSMVMRAPVYLAYLRAMPCVVCQRTEGIEAHPLYPQMGRNCSDLFSLSLCRAHHREFHDLGMDRFGRKYHVDCQKECMTLLARFITILMEQVGEDSLTEVHRCQTL